MWSIRRASSADEAVIVRHRRRMFEDMGYSDTAQLDRADSVFAAWLAPRLASGAYVGLLAERDAQVIAGVGVWLQDWVPSPRSPEGARAYILNVYTEPEHRRQGIAQALMVALLDWCREAGYPGALLHASDEGRALYQRLGFNATNEMGIVFHEGK